MCTKLCGKAWPILFVLVAVVLGVLASVWPQERLADIVYISRFFDVMLPVLAVGALIKYLFRGGKCCCSACFCGKEKEEA